MQSIPEDRDKNLVLVSIRKDGDGAMAENIVKDVVVAVLRGSGRCCDHWVSECRGHDGGLAGR